MIVLPVAVQGRLKDAQMKPPGRVPDPVVVYLTAKVGPQSEML